MLTPTWSPREKSPLLEAQGRIKPVILYYTGRRAQHTTDYLTFRSFHPEAAVSMNI